MEKYYVNIFLKKSTYIKYIYIKKIKKIFYLKMLNINKKIFE